MVRRSVAPVEPHPRWLTRVTPSEWEASEVLVRDRGAHGLLNLSATLGPHGSLGRDWNFRAMPSPRREDWAPTSSQDPGPEDAATIHQVPVNAYVVC